LTTTTSVTSTTRKASLFSSSSTNKHVDNDHCDSQHQKDVVYSFTPANRRVQNHHNHYISRKAKSIFSSLQAHRPHSHFTTRKLVFFSSSKSTRSTYFNRYVSPF
jgi:hypothetical protein